MTTLKDIETAISNLTLLEYNELRRWMEQYTGPQPIDLQIQASLETGHMDESIRRAKADYEAGHTTLFQARLAVIHRANEDFRQDYRAVPASICAGANKQCALFEANPFHSSLQFKKVGRRS